MNLLMEYKYIAYALVALGALVAVYFLWRTLRTSLDAVQQPIMPDDKPTETSEEQFERLKHFLDSEPPPEEFQDDDDVPELIAGGKPQMQKIKKRWPSYKPPHKG